jgi:hypothetical protein
MSKVDLTDPDDPNEGHGDPDAYDGLAAQHIETETGQAEVETDHAALLAEGTPEQVDVPAPDWAEEGE